MTTQTALPLCQSGPARLHARQAAQGHRWHPLDWIGPLQRLVPATQPQDEFLFHAPRQIPRQCPVGLRVRWTPSEAVECPNVRRRACEFEAGCSAADSWRPWSSRLESQDRLCPARWLCVTASPAERPLATGPLASGAGSVFAAACPQRFSAELAQHRWPQPVLNRSHHSSKPPACDLAIGCPRKSPRERGTQWASARADWAVAKSCRAAPLRLADDWPLPPALLWEDLSDGFERPRALQQPLQLLLLRV